ncbi:MAG: NADH-quinone oxidoreductase subunit NuoG [Actinomycetota bacterium]|nr:NADH-quinone oxidoreductase subunit NuoG [Actinomycetota bacterium]
MNGNGANPPQTVTVTINGRTAEVEEGRLLIDVAEEMNVFVPRFCYHPGMKSVAVCRMCLVAVEGQRKLMPACATPVADGMNVNTVEEQAVDAQRGMLEFLLINHPLDCPICDRGGECPLQDQTYRHGPGSTRYVEPKRTFEKPIEISNLVVLDRERCVLCWRCVRFADEIAGDQFIQLVDRGAGTQILTFKDDPFDSYFSGNTIQICPVGALTSRPYRFLSRPWNLKSAPSVCAYCSVGCPISNESRSEKLVRCQAMPNENVNDFWICDKGRFGYHYVDSDERLSAPLVRSKEDQFDQASWGDAVATAAGRLKDAKVGIIAGGHLTTEDAFAVARLARKVLETPHIDSRVQDDGAPYDQALQVGGAAGSTATLNDLERASSIVWIGPDPKETLPVLYLRLRKAALDFGARVAVVSPRRISLDYFANHIVRTTPGGETDSLHELQQTNAFDFGERPVVCWGSASPGRDESPTFSAALQLVRSIGARLLVCPPHAGSQGLIDMGVLPTLQAGYKPVDEPGMSTREMLRAAADGDIDTLMVVGADLISDFPEAGLAERALSKAFTIVVELLPTDTVAYADVVLPASAYAEREATFTNLERRLQKLEQSVAAPGSASDPWRICVRIAEALGDDWGWQSFADVWKAIRAEVPTHSDVDVEALGQHPPLPRPEYGAGWQGDPTYERPLVAGPGGQYPKGFRSGAPFQTGQNWPLSWELRAFEARQRPGIIPSVDGASSGISTSEGGESLPAPAEDSAGAGSDRTFTLLTGRLIYDEGAMISKTAALRGIATRPYIEISEVDAGRLELADGDDATVSGNGFKATLRVVVSDLAEGAVFIPYDQEGLRANRLIGSINPTVEVSKT